MGVFQWFVKLLYRSLLFLIRLPRPVFTFITGLFGVMDKSQKSVTQGSFMGNSSSSFYDDSEQYDSTWEDEPDQDTTEPTEQSSWGPYRNRRAAQDMQAYRRYYQLTVTDGGTDDDGDDDDMENDEDSPNVQFYRNKICFYPNGVCIEDFHEYWAKDYDKLEYVHSYIQWLFPIQEKGMNYESQELSLKEIKLFRRDETVKKRLLQSYKIMLDFYGIELVSEESGEVKRAENWRERFENLNRNTHNNLRITRIIKSLGLLGFGHYQKPLVQFFLNEALVKKSLPRVKQSVLDYFMFAVLDKKERKELIKFAFCNFKSSEEFVWCPRRIRTKFKKEIDKTGKSSDTTSQSDQNVLMDSTVQNRAEIKTDTNNEQYSSNESRNDENVPGECHESEKQALPVTAGGNANTCDNNEGTEGVDSEHDGHKNSVEATIQTDVSKTGNEITNSGQKATEKSHENGNEDADSTKETKSAHNSTENLPQTSDHSSKSENFANETPLSDPGSEQQDQQDDSEQGNTEDNKSQNTGGDSKEKKSEEILTSGSESPEDRVATGTETDNEANSAHCDETESAGKNSHEHTLSEEEDNASSGHFEQTSEQNPVSSKETHTPGPDRNKEGEQQESDQSDESLNEEKNVQNLDEGNEQKNQGDETLNQLKVTAEAKGQADEKTEDPLHQDNTEERFTDKSVSNVITSDNNENSDSADVKNRDSAKSEQGTALKSDMNSSQGIPGEDTETEESSNEKSVLDQTTFFLDKGTEKQENI